MTEILENIKKKFPGTVFPSAIHFDYSDDGKKIKILLDWKHIVSENMQVVGNAFEGWAIAAYLGMNKRYRIELCVEGRCNYSYRDYPHMARFLYRAMKFSEQYNEWFDLSNDLIEVTANFKHFLYNEKIFVNIFPKQKATSTEHEADNSTLNENIVEAKLAEEGKLKNILGENLIGTGTVYRQLPVGLFEGTIETKNAVFTYGHSAIDLWNINDEKLNVIELKTQNRMIGIITEIFFYSNFMYDFVCTDNNLRLSEVPEKHNKENLRGYDELYGNKDKIKRIEGILLADDDNFHPCVTSETIVVLNHTKNDKIHYTLKSYHIKKMDVVIS